MEVEKEKATDNQNTKIQEALKVLADELRSDAGYYNSWQANIAMQFKDEYQRQQLERSTFDLHKIANNAAKNFLNLLKATREELNDND